MSDTIAIALVTALSTLLGIFLTGLVTLRQRREEHEEQLAAWKRGLRRDVYVQFISEAATLEAESDRFWSNPLPKNYESVLRDLRSRLRRLQGISYVLALEGPPPVAQAADTYHTAAKRQIEQMEIAAQKARRTRKTKAVGTFTREVWIEYEKMVWEMRESFLEQARSALS
ncbi:hypothetical protein ACFZCY_06425 [Streptomyces sp. NPDC007983]|uniref:hypothetical protein n=1 Tax=Streptomyces sp. NPDC007983 TaxID=3364800 RepID=UPI0036F13524